MTSYRMGAAEIIPSTSQMDSLEDREIQWMMGSQERSTHRQFFSNTALIYHVVHLGENTNYMELDIDF